MNGWVIPETLPPLKQGGLQVWRVWLEHPEFSRQAMQDLLETAHAALTDGERKRAARMRAGSPREEFVAGRGCLRLLLGSMTRAEPCELVFETGDHGKPELVGDGVQFNVAHSKGMVLIALSRAGAVGVDVEFVDASVELMDVARTAFHEGDVARIAAAGTWEARLAEFYRCWTWKEAIAKADGRGLTIPVSELEIGDGKSFGPFFAREIEVGADHVAALASETDGVAVEFYEILPSMAQWFARKG